MNTQNIPISKLQCNEGQVEGLPRNPRFIKDERFEKLKKSLQDDPEMLELRELIVYPHGNKFVVIGGNMRLRAAKQLGFKDMPCKVLPEDTPIEKLKAYTIKDNNAFGNDDFDLLANEWDVEFLEECGFEFGETSNVSPEDFGTSFSLNDGEKSPFQQMTFTLADIQAEQIKQAVETIKEEGIGEMFGNTNSNGNALYKIVIQWANARK